MANAESEKIETAKKFRTEWAASHEPAKIEGKAKLPCVSAGCLMMLLVALACVAPACREGRADQTPQPTAASPVATSPASTSHPAARVLQATEEKDTAGKNVVQVTLPGTFSAEFRQGNGFSHFYDLVHDRDKKRNICAAFTGSGLFWFIIYPPSDLHQAHDFANPRHRAKLIESNDVRARVELSGKFTQDGRDIPSPWSDIDFTETYTIYPTGNFYLGFAMHNNKKEGQKCPSMDVFLNTTSGWATTQSGGVNEMKRFCEFSTPTASPDPTEYTVGYFKPSSWIMHSSNGPTYFEDVALIMARGRYLSNMWLHTFPPAFTRTNLSIRGDDADPFFKAVDAKPGYSPSLIIPSGESRIAMLYRFATDMKGQAAVQPRADDYRSPDALKFVKGAADTKEPGDENHDGFNEEEGCYVMTSGSGGAEFVLTGTKGCPRHDPVFKLKDWKGALPASVTLNGDAMKIGKDYNTASHDGTLLVQLFKTVDSPARIRIGN
jgi:hypothetical protein